MENNADIDKKIIHGNGKQDTLKNKEIGAETLQTDYHSEVKEHLDLPYKGLNPYTEDDANIFFGREKDIQKVVNNLFAWPLTILYGKSGVGKSSILRAGVTHALNKEARQNIADYDGAPKLAVVVFPSLEGEFSWKDEPVASLMKQIEQTIAQSGLGIQPPEPGLSFVDTLRHWTDALGGKDKDGTLYLILDQFEEYFLYHPQGNKEDRFAVEFTRALNHPDLQVNFLISIREEYYTHLDRFKGRVPNLLDIYNNLRLDHLDRDSARTAILDPVEEYNRQHQTSISIEDKLVEAVLDQVKVGKLAWAGQGSINSESRAPDKIRIETPYLQLVMTRLWEEEIGQSSQCLQLKTLNQLGNARGIVKAHLKFRMDQLTLKEKDTSAEIFSHLVTPSGTKIAQTVDDLVNYANEGKTSENTVDSVQVSSLLQKLSKWNSRILRRIGPDPRYPNAGDRYEIFHDVLAGAVLDWRRQHQEDRELYILEEKQLEVEIRIWQYIADILDEKKNKVSENTRREMRIELNKYHIPKLYHHKKKAVEDLKNMLEKLGCYKRNEGEEFNSEIDEKFVTSIVQFQQERGLVLVDGIVGPETLDRMEAELKNKFEEKS